LEIKDRIAQARIDSGLSETELAEKLGIDKSTISNWESGRRLPSQERLVQLTEVLGVSANYLLGLDNLVTLTEPVNASVLPVLHCTPVWCESRGWALINAIKRTLVFANKSDMAFDDMQEPVYVIPPAFALSLRGMGEPLEIDDVIKSDRVWVEPISSDYVLAAELRGWYNIHNQRLVENEYGNRFYLDTYGAKWLAFESCFSELHESD